MTKRKRRPAAAALLALFTGLLLLPPIAAQAGPDSTEVLVDNDNDALTAPVREFGGATRYETSLATAQRFVRTANSAGTSVTTALIASGESLVDAAAAAGLARAANAPLLLTRSNSLFEPAAHLIEREGISRVLVLGEVEAVSAQVLAALAAVSGVTSVARIGGANRYVTAALIAQQMNSQAGYCGTGQVSAILVRGEESTFADITIAGPVSFAFGIPILLTAAEGLPAETSAALTGLGTEHVVAIGAAATSDLVSELATLGINDVTSFAGSGVAGSSSSDTSVDLARALSTCPGNPFSRNTVALISATALPDGISAAPMLGQGLGTADRTTPVLLVEPNALPPAVRDFLATQCRALEITAIGGEEAIAADVVASAVDAANSAPPCTPANTADKDRYRDDRDNAPLPFPLSLVDATGAPLVIGRQTLNLASGAAGSVSFNVGVTPNSAKLNTRITATSSNPDAIAVSVEAVRSGQATHRVTISSGSSHGSASITIRTSSPGSYSDVRYQFSATNEVRPHFIDEAGDPLTTPAQTLPASGTGSQSKSITFGVLALNDEPISVLTARSDNTSVVTTVLTEEVNGEATHRLTFNKGVEAGVATITIRAEANGHQPQTHRFQVTNQIQSMFVDGAGMPFSLQARVLGVSDTELQVPLSLLPSFENSGVNVEVASSHTDRVSVSYDQAAEMLVLTKGDFPGDATITLTTTSSNPNYVAAEPLTFTATSQIALGITGTSNQELPDGTGPGSIDVTVTPSNVPEAALSVTTEVTDGVTDAVVVDSPAVRQPDGTYRVTFSKGSVPGTATITLTASATDYETAMAEFTVNNKVNLRLEIAQTADDVPPDFPQSDVIVVLSPAAAANTVMFTTMSSKPNVLHVPSQLTIVDLDLGQFQVSYVRGSATEEDTATITVVANAPGYQEGETSFEVTSLFADLEIADVSSQTLAAGVGTLDVTVMVTPDPSNRFTQPLFPDIELTPVSSDGDIVTASTVRTDLREFTLTLTRGSTPGTAMVTLTASTVTPGYISDEITFMVTVE